MYTTDISTTVRPKDSNLTAACPICHSHPSGTQIRARDVAFATDTEAVYAICKTCHHIFLIRPSASEAVRFAEPSQGFVVRVMNHPLVSLLLYAPRIRWLKRHVRLAPSTRILDIGCGTGQFLGLLKRQYGCDCLGLDLDPALIESGRKNGVNLQVVDFEKSFESDQRFDLITMFHVIEHFADPAGAIVRAGRHLRPGGWLCIETPASNAPSRRIFGASWFPLLPPYHRHLFSECSLEILLADALPSGRVIDRMRVYMAGEVSASTCLPLARYAPHPFRSQSTHWPKALLAVCGMAMLFILSLPGELLVATLGRPLRFAGHQRVLYREIGSMQ